MATRKHGLAHRRKVFRHGLLRAGAIAGALVGGSLLVWMGPTEPLSTNPAEIFAGVYALYSGLILIASTAVLLSPFMTHVLHAFHAEHDVEEGK